MRVLLLTLAGAAAFTVGSTDLEARPARRSNPLASLTGLARKIERAANQALQGKRSAAGGKIRMRVTHRAEQKIRSAGIKSLRLVGFELELIFKQGTTGTYYLRTMVHPGPRGPSFMILKGRVPYQGKLWTKGAPMGAYTGVVSPFALSARAMLRQARTKQCERWPITPTAAAQRLRLTGRVQQRFLRDLSRAKQGLPALCGKLRTVLAHSTTVHIDDAAFLARDAGGRILGVLAADMAVKNGRLLIAIKRFKPF